MTVSVWQELVATPVRVSHDVVVVGAGLVGSHIAGLLVHSGRDVALVEAHFPAAGASGRNAGFVLLGMRYRYAEAIQRFGHPRAREIWGMTAENLSRMRAFARRQGVEHEEIGTTYLAIDREEAASLRETAHLLGRDGFAAEWVDRDPLDRGFLGAMLVPGDLAIQPAALTHELARVGGATLYDNDEVFAIHRQGPGFTVRTRKTVFACGAVVLAVNAYAPFLHQFFQGLITPVREQVLLTEPLPRLLNTMGDAEGGYHFFRQLPDGRLLLGGGRRSYLAEETSYSEEVTEPIQRALGRFMARYLPDAVTVGVSRRWAGIDGATADGLPLVGQIPGEPGLYFAVGFSGHGNSMGMIAGEQLVELLLHGREPGVFDVRRLA